MNNIVMKKYSALYLLFALLLAAGCSDDDKVTLYSIQQSVIETLPAETLDLGELTESGTNPLLFTIRWSPTEFLTSHTSGPTPVAPLTYNVEIDRIGAGFASARTYAATSADSVDVFVDDMNTFLINELSAVASNEVQVEVRIVSKYGEGDRNTSYSSNVETVTLIPYDRTDPMQPVYLVGDMNGWNTSNSDYMIFRANSDPGARIYTYTGRLNGYFKFIPESSLGTNNMYYTAGDGTLAYGESDGGAFYVEDKYVTITLDLNEMTWTMMDYDTTDKKNYEQIWIAGVFNNWPQGGTDLGKLQKWAYDPHIWSATVTMDDVEYGVKFNAGTWGEKWCPSVTSDVPYGVSEYNPAHDNNIDLKGVAGTYFVQLNDLTGHYILIKK